METAPPPPVYGHTVFCDDIRSEVGGKVTFVGVYQSEMTVQGATFPLLLPRFGFGVVYSQRRDLFRPEFVVRIYLPGDKDDAPSIELSLPDDPIFNEEINRLGESPPDDPRYVVRGMNIPVSPLIIPQEGLIKVRVVREDKMIRLGSLMVKLAETPQA